MNNKPTFLLINPWIYDFAAFDLHLKPLGLLTLAANLKKLGCNILFLDCMNRLDNYFSNNNLIDNKKYGTGKFYYEIIEKPEILTFFPRHFKRYGIPFDEVKKRLSDLKGKKIDGILVTSIMTYWYPGVFDMIKLIKKNFKRTPVFLGGIYTTLMYEHALKYSCADHIIPGTDLFSIINKIFSVLNINKSPGSIKKLADQEEPLFDVYPDLDYLVVLLSKGCPFHCSYCASKLLCNKFIIKNIKRVIEKTTYYILKYNIKNIAFYDDALLYNFPDMLKKFLSGLKEFNINYHTPNGLHVNLITREVAEFFYRFNFKTIRISLETSSTRIQKITGKKITDKQFFISINNLLNAGFVPKDLEVYVLFGFPDQKLIELKDTIKLIKNTGAIPKLVEYSLIPGTHDYSKYFHNKNYDPLLLNNSVFYQKFTSFSHDDLTKLREMSKV